MGMLSAYFDIRKSFPFYAAYHKQPTNIAIHIIGIPIIATTALYFLSNIELLQFHATSFNRDNNLLAQLLFSPVKAGIAAANSSTGASAGVGASGTCVLTLADLISLGYGLSFLFLDLPAGLLYLLGPMPLMRYIACSYLHQTDNIFCDPSWWFNGVLASLGQLCSSIFSFGGGGGSSTASSTNTMNNNLTVGVTLHVIGWIAQFVGHGIFEKKKPALMDSFFQSVHAAVFFQWLEVLFYGFNYKPGLQRELEVLMLEELPEDERLSYLASKKERQKSKTNSSNDKKD